MIFPHTDVIKANEYSLLHRATRLFLREVSTRTTEMRLPSLPGSQNASKVTINFAVKSEETVKCRNLSLAHLDRYY
jgi:hypothetical protein